jgi:MFS family permease
MIVAVINGLGNGVFNIALPFTIMDRFSSAYTAVSSASAAASLGTMLVLLIGGRIADRSGRRGIILITVCLEPIMILGMFLSNSLWQLLMFLILTTMVGNSASPAINAVLLEAVPDRDIATFGGLWQGLNSAGFALGAFAAGVSYGLSPTLTRMAPLALFLAQFPMYAIAIPKKKAD